MSDFIDVEFVAFLSRSYGLSADVCRRLILEFLAEYEQTLDEFVQRRHVELKSAEGLKNEESYRRIGEEVQQRRFSPPKLSERQIRRIIYG